MDENSLGDFYSTSETACIVYGIIDSSTRTTEALNVKRKVCLGAGSLSFILGFTPNYGTIFFIKDPTFVRPDRLLMLNMGQDANHYHMTVADEWDLAGVDFKVNYFAEMYSNYYFSGYTTGYQSGSLDLSSLGQQYGLLWVRA